tara:strand:+ start:207 stop:452 length:246 start_codon:yes stop_codon:yes gene_type:complete
MKYYVRVWWLNKTVSDIEFADRAAAIRWTAHNGRNEDVYKYDIRQEWPKRAIGGEFCPCEPTWDYSDFGTPDYQHDKYANA